MNPSELPPSVYIQKKLTSIHIDEWLSGDVFRLRWWGLVLMILASLAVWLILLDKSRMKSVVLFAAIETVLSLALVEYGEELLLWDYPTDVIPIFPPLTSVNLLLLPLAFSLVYQYFRTAKRFLLAAAALSAILSFVVEPLLAWGGFYQLVNWKYYFSFPIYLLAAAVTRCLTHTIDGITAKYAHAGRPNG